MQARVRKAACAAACVLGAALGCLPTLAQAQLPYLAVPRNEPKTTAIVMDSDTGEILYSERADSPRYPASVTKLMTFDLAFEGLASGQLHLDDRIMVSPLAAAQPPTKLGLRAGATISLANALHAMAVHSANDMAVAVAEHIGGTESRFAAMMTAKARQLGMDNTLYVNANGLPDSRQVTTAHDIAILTRYILRRYPQYYHMFFSQEEFTYDGRTMYNTNHLLGKMPGVDGVKTGFTNAAGFNLDASAVRNGHRLIVVVMGSSSPNVRNSEVENLLLTGFDIEDRRDRGERVEYTQNLFNPFGVVPRRVTAPAWRAQDDSDPIGVVLTRYSSNPPPVKVSGSLPAARSGARGPQARNWWIQVGEFRHRNEARAQVEHVARRFSVLVDNAEGSVDGTGRRYRARFSGFTESEAQQACRDMRAHGEACAVGDEA